MVSAPQISAFAIATLLIASLPVASHLAKAGAAAATPPANCQDEAGLAMLASPAVPWKGAALRVVFVAETPLEGELSLVAPDQ